MLRSYWHDYFLFGVLSFAVIFVLFVGWTIFQHEETQQSTSFNPEENSAPQPVPSPQIIKPKYYAMPDKFSSDFTRQMLDHMQDTNPQLQQYMPPTKFFSDAFEDGFEWAATQKIKHTSQCQSQIKDYFDGCRTFVEIDHYINRIQVIQKFR